jgi:RNA polymerase sigma factor (sigma-70 family)
VTDSPNEWDDETLARVVEDPRRLELLSDDQLRHLSTDTAALFALSDELIWDWCPAWNPLFSAAGREVRDKSGMELPLWNDLATSPAPPVDDPSLLVGSFGHAAQEEVKSGGRALLLSWEWERAREELSDMASAAERRKVVTFRLRAYDARASNPGGWVLTMAGAPADDSARVVVVLTGWGRSMSDEAHPVRTGMSVDIVLDHLLPPGELLIEWQVGCATVSVNVTGQHDWSVTQEVPPPGITRDLWELWCIDPVFGAAALLGRLQGWTGSRDRDLLEEVLYSASRDVVRVRNRLTRVSGLRDFSRVVWTAARNRFLATTRGRHTRAPLGDDLPADGPSPEDESLRSETFGVVAACVAELSRRDRELLALRYDDGLQFEDIGRELGLTSNAARQAHLNAIRRLRERLTRRGVGADALLALRGGK